MAVFSGTRPLPESCPLGALQCRDKLCSVHDGRNVFGVVQLTACLLVCAGFIVLGDDLVHARDVILDARQQQTRCGVFECFATSCYALQQREKRCTVIAEVDRRPFLCSCFHPKTPPTTRHSQAFFAFKTSVVEGCVLYVKFFWLM